VILEVVRVGASQKPDIGKAVSPTCHS